MARNNVLALLEKEEAHQEETINMIASESYPSKEILAAVGSLISNKYSEGYPGKRYYSGTKIVDEIELLAIESAKSLFHAEHANVQSHSGTQANMAVFQSVLKPGDTILGMDMACGGHMSHGSRFNFSGKLYKTKFYSVDRKLWLIDYDDVLRIAKAVSPKLIIAGASSYSRKIDFRKFRTIADEVGAFLLCDIAHIAGFCAAGLHENPAPYADFTTFTTQKSMLGPKGGIILCKKEYADLIDKNVFPGTQGGPINGIIAAKAICLETAKSPEFKKIMVRAISISKLFVGYFSRHGLDVVSGGSDNHIVLLDLSKQNLDGVSAQEALEKAGILCNKNLIPFDAKPPQAASGIRLGSICLAQRGFDDAEIEKIAECILSTLQNIGKQDEAVIREKNKVIISELCKKHSIYNSSEGEH